MAGRVFRDLWRDQLFILQKEVKAPKTYQLAQDMWQSVAASQLALSPGLTIRCRQDEWGPPFCKSANHFYLGCSLSFLVQVCRLMCEDTRGQGPNRPSWGSPRSGTRSWKKKHVHGPLCLFMKFSQVVNSPLWKHVPNQLHSGELLCSARYSQASRASPYR